MPFDPHHLTPNASLNRLVLASAPAPYTGQRAYDLLSRAALIALIQSQAILPADGDDLPRQLDTLLQAQHPVALQIAEEMGTRLGWLLHTLKKGDPADRAARLDWDNTHWEQWAQLEQIKAGGGLIAGELGRHMITRGRGGYALERAPEPALLPVYGAGRNVSSGLIFDFGQTQVKIAYKRQANSQPYLIKTVTAPLFGDAQVLLAGMADIIASSIHEMPMLIPQCAVIFASYLDTNRQPVPGGIYGLLREISADVNGLLCAAIQQQSGWQGQLHFWHDGTAAAHYYAGQPRTAVIMLGTALGVGFAPSNA